jgi:hypothetical protein
VWAVWAATGAGDLWPAWLTGLWGIGLVLNAWDVYFRMPITEADVQREIQRLHPKHGGAAGSTDQAAVLSSSDAVTNAWTTAVSNCVPAQRTSSRHASS